MEYLQEAIHMIVSLCVLVTGWTFAGDGYFKVLII